MVPGLYIQYIVSIAKIINTLTIFNIMIVLIENSLPAQFRGNGVLELSEAYPKMEIGPSSLRLLFSSESRLPVPSTKVVKWMVSQALK